MNGGKKMLESVKSVTGVCAGWRREVVHRGASKQQTTPSSSKHAVDIYYFSPSNIKLVSTKRDESLNTLKG